MKQLVIEPLDTWNVVRRSRERTTQENLEILIVQQSDKWAFLQIFSATMDLLEGPPLVIA